MNENESIEFKENYTEKLSVLYVIIGTKDSKLSLKLSF